MAVSPPHAGRLSVYAVLAALLAALPLPGCTSSCGVADQIDMLDNGVKLGGKAYSLVRRISGFQDKVVTYELFAGELEFDECGHTAADPVAHDGYDPEQGHIKALVFKNGRLNIVYTRRRKEAVLPGKLRLMAE